MLMQDTWTQRQLCVMQVVWWKNWWLPKGKLLLRNWKFLRWAGNLPLLWNFVSVVSRITLDPILSHFIASHTKTPYFVKINFNIFLPSMPGSLKICPDTFRLSSQNFISCMLHVQHAPCPLSSCVFWLTVILSDDKYSWSSCLSVFTVHCYLLSLQS